MRQPNTLFYMETYCGDICQCRTTNKILLIEALDNFKIYCDDKKKKEIYDCNYLIKKKVSSPNHGKEKILSVV